MRITVVFHGILGKLCPGKHEVEANNAFEALRIVCKNNETKLMRKNGHQFKCFVKECPKDEDLYTKGKTDVLNVLPSFCPSGGGTSNAAWKQTAIIAALVVVTALSYGVFSSAGFARLAVTPGSASFMGSVYMSGILLTAGAWLGSLSQHISKKSKPDQNVEQQNYAFGLNGNTVSVGTAIPIAYGRYLIHGHLLSIGTEATAGAVPLSVIQSRE